LLLQDPDLAHLLVVGAYHDNEVDETHRLIMGVAELKKAGVFSEHIELHNLTVQSMSDLLADTLLSDSALIFKNKSGNGI
jgi:hypothetical protein